MARILGPLVTAALVTTACGGHPHDDQAGQPDDAAQAACANQTTTGTALSAADTEAGAAVNTRISHQGTYTITLPEGEPGFVTINVDVEHNDWALFTRGDVNITRATFGGVPIGVSGGVPNGACPSSGVLDRRFHFHDTGDYFLEFSASGDRTVWIYIERTGTDHAPDGG